ncbi:hypothetical protein NPS46_06335 [Pseudomonas putida]|uniref:hypothetical protein n=1 Tax=Pseudomonas putida TaxID=303 RepID=UPI00236421A5|nr:hypothetical protein [Pseudomonas putida]MDD2052165.1 hypothetical protein [Pseudomonas putida]
MFEIALNLTAIVALYCAIEYCLKHHTQADDDEASAIPFADDPEVARRVEQATGKPIKAVQIDEPRRAADWGDFQA